MAEIRNPNQPGGGGQDSRTLLIFSVVFVLIFLGLQYFSPKKKTQPETPAEVASTSAPKAPAAPASPVTAGPASSKAATDAVVAAAETTTVIENELYRITFSNRGAQATSWILKKYKDDSGKPLDLWIKPRMTSSPDGLGGTEDRFVIGVLPSRKAPLVHHSYNPFTAAGAAANQVVDIARGTLVGIGQIVTSTPRSFKHSIYSR